MKKEYMKPEAEMVKFVEEEDLMTMGDTINGSFAGTGKYTGGSVDFTFD